MSSHVVLLGDSIFDNAAYTAGGNDALSNMDLLATPVPSTTAALALFDQRVSGFEAAYRSAIDRALELRKALTICTIYNGNLEPREARLARVALMTFNDAILRVGFEYTINVIDLRLVCSEPSDYANPIDPSGSGGRKIARSILSALQIGKGRHSASQVFAL